MKKFLSVLLVLCVCLSMCSVNVFASEPVSLLSLRDKYFEDIGYINEDISISGGKYVPNVSNCYYSITEVTGDEVTITNLNPDKNYVSFLFTGYHYLKTGRADIGCCDVTSYSMESNGDIFKCTFLPLVENEDDADKIYSVTDSLTIKLSDFIDLAKSEDLDWEYYSSDTDGVKWCITVYVVPKDNSDDYYSRRVSYLFEDSYGENVALSFPFKDVSMSDYYFSPISWAWQHRVSEGTSATTFSPNDACTHNQILTFLHRQLNGVISSEADDKWAFIPDGKYYSEALTWAKNLDIINEDTYLWDSPCSRRDLLDYMYHLYNERDVIYSGASDMDKYNKSVEVVSKMSDIDSDKLRMMVVWAVYNGLMNGTSETTFSPDEICTRGQIITVLYRLDSLDTYFIERQ